LDQRDSNTTPMIATITAPANTLKLSVGLGEGIYKPRLLRKNASPTPRLSRGPGKESMTAKYQKKI
jgi:hypothetical protein